MHHSSTVLPCSCLSCICRCHSESCTSRFTAAIAWLVSFISLFPPVCFRTSTCFNCSSLQFVVLHCTTLEIWMKGAGLFGGYELFVNSGCRNQVVKCDTWNQRSNFDRWKLPLLISDKGGRQKSVGHNDPLIFDDLAEPFLWLQRLSIWGFISVIDKPLKTQKKQGLKMRSCFLVTVNVTICIRTVSLYHLSEITILHDTAQKAVFSRLFGHFRAIYREG